MSVPKFRVFSSDNIELAPCHPDRAFGLVRKNKAYFVSTPDQETILVINRSSEQILAKEGKEDER